MASVQRVTGGRGVCSTGKHQKASVFYMQQQIVTKHGHMRLYANLIWQEIEAVDSKGELKNDVTKFNPFLPPTGIIAILKHTWLC